METRQKGAFIEHLAVSHFQERSKFTSWAVGKGLTNPFSGELRDVYIITYTHYVKLPNDVDNGIAN